MKPWSAGAHSRTAGSEGNSMDQGWDSWQGMPYSTKGSQQAMPKKGTFPKLSLLLYFGPASIIIRDQFIGYVCFYTLDEILVPCAVHTFVSTATATQKSSSEVLDCSLESGLTKISSSQGCLIPSHYFWFSRGRKVIRAKGYNMALVPLKDFSGRTPGISLDLHP